LYQYLPRTLWGGLRSAWAIEAARSGARNRMWAYGAAWIALVGVVGAVFGGLGVALFFGQSAVAVLLLETINYVEHYGLRRAEIAPGKPERVKPHHSWNSSHRLSNWMLLNLARHSDHHAFAARAFPELRHHDDVPQLPASYSAMVMLATVPPLWFRLMDPRVAALAPGASPAI
jgi:alkane 1-monooxygenase